MSNTNYIVYRQEDEPKNKNGVWIHHKVYKDLSSPIVVQIYSQGKWQDIKGGQPSSGTIEGVGIKSIQSITKDEYDVLEEKDPETIYIVKNDPTNGHEWVDLGLTDDDGYHIVWAAKNIGAENPWDAGKYFAWADTVGYYADEGHEFSQANAPYWDSEGEEYTKYTNEDGLTELQPEDDAAHTQWGGKWAIISLHEFENCGIKSAPFELIEDHDINCIKSGDLILPLAGFFEDAIISGVNEYFELWTKALESSISANAITGESDGMIYYETFERHPGTTIRPIIKVKDLSELDPTYDIYLGEDKIVDNSTEDSNMTNILYEDLVALRDNSKLVPGMWYRITDYQTTIALTGTRSAGHQFDVIVLATDVNKLSEDAKAIMHNNIYDVTFADGITKKCYLYHIEDIYYNLVDCNTLLGIDGISSEEFEINENQKTIFIAGYDSDALTLPDLQGNYFQDCNLEAWKLKYSMEEPPTRLYSVSLDAWLTYSGEYTVEGVTYHGFGTLDKSPVVMLLSSYEVPESGFPVWITEDGEEWHDGEDYGESVNRIETTPSNYKGKISRMIDEFNNDCPYDFKNIQFQRYMITSCASVPSLVGEYGISGFNAYTIDENSVVYAYTFSSQVNGGTVTDSSIISDDTNLVYNNVIKEYDTLNDIVLFGNNCHNNTFGNNCYSNTFGNNCNNNTFGSNCAQNTFGTGCNNNTFVGNCSRNLLGGRYIKNTLGCNCNGNKFDMDCNKNTFGNDCGNNTFGSDCNANAFCSNCNSNTFSNNCVGNRFGIGCSSNTFGNVCGNNTFGDGCGGNTFGGYCSNNTLGTGCSLIKFGTLNSAKSYYYYIIVENGNMYICLDCTATTSTSRPYRNIIITQGVNNTTTWKTITDSNVNQSYQTKVAVNTNGDLKIYCDADLVP